MLRRLLFLWVLCPLAPGFLRAQDTLQMHQPGVPMDSSRIGVPSPLVIQQRLKLLGHTDIEVVAAEQGIAYANTVKNGRNLAVKLDVFSGKVVQQPGRLRLMRQGVRLIKPSGAVVAPPR